MTVWVTFHIGLVTCQTGRLARQLKRIAMGIQIVIFKHVFSHSGTKPKRLLQATRSSDTKEELPPYAGPPGGHCGLKNTCPTLS